VMKTHRDGSDFATLVVGAGSEVRPLFRPD